MLSHWGGGVGRGRDLTLQVCPWQGLLIIRWVFLTNNNNPGVRNLYSFDPGWHPWGRAFEQKNWSEFKSPAYARPPPQQLNIDKCIILGYTFQSTHRVKSFFPYKIRTTVSKCHESKVVYKASCWDCQDFYVGKTKRRLHDRIIEYLKWSRVADMRLLLSQSTSRRLAKT